MRFFIFVFALIALVGCVSAAPQSDTLLLQSGSQSRSYVIHDVPYVRQSDNYCGPATLAMAWSWNDKPVSLDEAAALVYTPGVKGTLQVDMISASRRQGLVAIPIMGMSSLLAEIDNHHPVIVFENLAVRWLPQWHYAIVYGYDLQKEVVYMHSGPERDKIWDLRKLERSWKLADYWGLVIVKPGQLVKTASELDHLKAAAALEKLHLWDAAEKTYSSILTRWPNSVGANLGLGNIAYTQGDYKKAVGILKAAVKENPESKELANNLAVAQKALK